MFLPFYRLKSPLYQGITGSNRVRNLSNIILGESMMRFTSDPMFWAVVAVIVIVGTAIVVDSHII